MHGGALDALRARCTYQGWGAACVCLACFVFITPLCFLWTGAGGGGGGVIRPIRIDHFQRWARRKYSPPATEFCVWGLDSLCNIRSMSTKSQDFSHVRGPRAQEMSCLRYVFLMLAVHCIGLAGQCNPATHAANDTKTLKAWLMEKYDRWSVPNATILVGTSLRLIHIYGIDTEMDSYWMELQILADWVDCNLAYDAELNPSIPYLAWSWRDSEIWQPDFLPVNLRDDYVYPIGGVQVYPAAKSV